MARGLPPVGAITAHAHLNASGYPQPSSQPSARSAMAQVTSARGCTDTTSPAQLRKDSSCAPQTCVPRGTTSPSWTSFQVKAKGTPPVMRLSQCLSVTRHSKALTSHSMSHALSTSLAYPRLTSSSRSARPSMLRSTSIEPKAWSKGPLPLCAACANAWYTSACMSHVPLPPQSGICPVSASGSSLTSYLS
jgi:hypothetical protein